MPNCPICHSELPNPPEDVRDWFRCETCGTPLQISTTVGKIIFAASIAVLFLVCWSLPALLSHIPWLRKFLPNDDFLSALIGDAGVATIYAFFVRFLWKSKLFQPRPYDPYSSLNLSDDRKKLRGNR